MDKITAGLLGAVAGAATLNVALAANGQSSRVAETLSASSYADLLSPIDDAVGRLKAHDAELMLARQTEDSARLEDVQQFYYQYGYPAPYYSNYHHHHHHHHHYRRHYYRPHHQRHHHHHHHHH